MSFAVAGEPESAVPPPPTQARGEPLALLYRWVLLAFLVLLTALARDFARLELTIAGVPLFTSELTIVILAALLAALSMTRRRLAVRLDLAGWLLLVYLLFGLVFALVGLKHGFGLAALRDFALVYYLVFSFFTLAFLQNGGRISHLINAMTAGAATGAALKVLQFLLMPALHWEHAAPGYTALMAWVGAMWLAVKMADTRNALVSTSYLAAILVCTAVIYLSAYRTMAAVIVVCMLVFALFASWFSRGTCLKQTAVLGVWFAVVGLAVLTHATETRQGGASLPVHGPTTYSAGLRVVSARWAAGLKLPGRTGIAVAEAVTESGDFAPYPQPHELVDSVGFRKLAWRNAVARIRSAPLTGIGFGPKAALFPDRFCDLVSSPLSNCGTAHNTYLTLAMRIGIPAFMLFLAVNVLVLSRLIVRHQRRRRGWGVWAVPPFMVAVLAGFATYGLTSLFLESPYLSILYWIVLGCLSHLAMASNSALGTGPAAGERALLADEIR